MSNRRKFLAGLGALASGSAAAIGTGAFTSVEADRTVNVAVADDANAYLGLDDIDESANSEYVDVSGEEVVLNLDSTNSGGSGFNANAETRIDDLIRVTNQGTQTVNVWVTLSGGSTFDDDTLYFYPGDATDTALNDGEGDGDGDNVLGLTPGESANLGVLVDLGDVSTASETPTATFHANVDEGDSSPVDESGGSFAVVAEDGSGDFSNLQTAIDNATGSTIVVKDTGNPLVVDAPVSIGVEGLDLRGINGNPTVEYRGGYSSPAVSVSADDVSIENIQFDFFGNGDDDSKTNFGGASAFLDTAGTNTTFRDSALNVIFVEEDGSITFDTKGGLALGPTPSASFINVDIGILNRKAGRTIAAVKDPDDAGEETASPDDPDNPGGGRPGGFYVLGKEIRNCTLRGGPKIATRTSAATVVGNTVKKVDATECLAVERVSAVNVQRNSFEYPAESTPKDYNGAEIRVEAGPGLKVNGENLSSASAVAKKLSENNTGSQTTSGNAAVINRSGSSDVYSPSSLAPSE